MTGYRSVLAKHDVRALFSALLISTTGSWAYNGALLAFVFDRTHSLGWVGAAGFARFVPQLVFSVYGGVLAERTERIRLMMGSDLLCALWQGLLVVVAATHGAPALALVLAGLTAVSGVVYQPATAATISIVDEDDLVAANALNSTIEQLVVIAGPGIGAGLLAVSSASFVFAINAASFVASALILTRIRARSRPVDAPRAERPGRCTRCWSACGRSSASRPRTLVAYCVLVSFVYGTDTVLFVGVSEHRLGTGPQGFGYLLAGLGLGGVLAAGAVDRLAGSRRLGVIILLGALGYCLPTALLAIIHEPTLAFVVQVFRGAATLVVDVLAITALQRAAAPDQVARGSVSSSAFAWGDRLGTVLTPIAVTTLGLNGGLFVMAAAPAALAVAGYPALRAIDRGTAMRALELEPTVALLEQLGIFEKASRPILERLAPRRWTSPGTAIVTQGRADAMYAP